MSKQLDLSKYIIRTDLAVEAKEIVDAKRVKQKVKRDSGIQIFEEIKKKVKITTVDIDEKGEILHWRCQIYEQMITMCKKILCLF